MQSNAIKVQTLPQDQGKIDVTESRLLFVEGTDDAALVKHLLVKHVSNVALPVRIISTGGKTTNIKLNLPKEANDENQQEDTKRNILLNSLLIKIANKNDAKVGFVLDADDSAEQSYRDTQELLIQFLTNNKGYPSDRFTLPDGVTLTPAQQAQSKASCFLTPTSYKIDGTLQRPKGALEHYYLQALLKGYTTLPHQNCAKTFTTCVFGEALTFPKNEAELFALPNHKAKWLTSALLMTDSRLQNTGDIKFRSGFGYAVEQGLLSLTLPDSGELWPNLQALRDYLTAFLTP